MPCPTSVLEDLPGVDSTLNPDIAPEFVGPVVPLGVELPPLADPVVLTLGQFVFERLEIPESITVGGTQRTVIHQLIGGERVIDTLGRSDRVLSWSGLLYGDRAEARAQYLDGLRIAGDALTLTWSGYRYSVIVTEFSATFERKWQISYQIGCTVVQDLAASVTQVPLAVAISETGAGLQEALETDLADAQALAEEVEDSILTDALDAVDSALETVSDVATAAQDAIDSVLTPIATATKRVGTLINQAANTVANVSTLGGFLPSNKVSQNALGLASQSNGFLSTGRLYNIQSRLGRMDNALNNVKSLGTMVKDVRTAGANLFCAARDAFDDASRWDAIAAVNNLTDPFVDGVSTLKIPLSAPDNGGVLGNG